MKKIILLFFFIFIVNVVLAEDKNAVNNISKKEDTILTLEKSCDIGDTKGCVLLGAMYEEGKGVRQDYFKAIELYKKPVIWEKLLVVIILDELKVGVFYFRQNFWLMRAKWRILTKN